MLSIHDFKSRAGFMLDLLRRLVECESPTEAKVSVDRLGALLAGELQHLGATLQVEPQAGVGDHLIGRWEAGLTGKPVLLLCHMDTVHPIGSLELMPCRVQDGWLYGPGAQDMKAGIAIGLAAVAALLEQGGLHRPVTLLLTSDEETGSLTSRPLIESLARQAALVLCLEPCLLDGSLKTWRKGVGDFEVLVRGRATHAGADHAGGCNAIEELAHQVLAIQRMTDYPRGTTLNVGVIHGGTAANVVPDQARAEVDLRVMDSAEAGRILAQLQALQPVLAGTSIQVTGGLNRPPMQRDSRMAAAFQQAQVIGARLGLALTEGGTGGGSDANFVAPLGVPVLDGLGARGEGQHSERERIAVDSLPERAALLAAIISQWQD